MPTHAELAGRLLIDAAAFFKTIAEQNPAVAREMGENANAFAQMASLIMKAPQGVIQDKSHAELAGRLLADAADFFVTLGAQNEPLRDQMEENARVFRHISQLVQQNPLGILE